jgi:hypothetical protein
MSFKFGILKYLGVIFGLLLFSSCSDDTTENTIVVVGTPPLDYQGEVMYILEDLIHSGRQNSSIEGSFSHLDYNSSHGYYNAFKLFRHRGFEHHQIKEGELNSTILSKYNIILINLMDDDHRGFSESEILAIKDYVKKGGGLISIVDHTNAYGSSAKMELLLSEFGLTLPYELACDQPENTFKQYHWLLITRFAQHYITKGLTSIGLLAAGPITGAGSVAWTSEDGFSDFWNPDNPTSYWGNFYQDSDEPTKSNSILNALEYGEGRIIVVGDQNVFGNTYLGLGDNLKLLANSVEWLSGNEKSFIEEEIPWVEIGVDQRVDNHSLGDQSSTGYLSFFSHLSRQDFALSRAYFSQPQTTPHILIALEPENNVDANDSASYQTVMDEGNTLFLVSDPSKITEVAVNMINEYWPGIVFRDNSGDQLQILDSEGEEYPLEVLENVILKGELPIGKEIEFPKCNAIKIDDRTKVVAWLEDSQGKKCDLIVKNGEFYLFLQPSLWQNSSIRNGSLPPGEEQLKGIYLIEKVLLYFNQ